MKTVSTASKSLHVTSLILSGAIALAAAAPANADKRTPAPIVYATGTSPYPAGKPQYIEPSRSPDAKAKKQARIQFRYPGSPSPSQSEFEAAEQGAAYEAPSNREYASITTPASAMASAGSSSANSFDARAAAARMEAERAVSAVESEPLPSLQPVAATAPTPVPPAASVTAPQYQKAARQLTPADSYTVSSEPVPVFDEMSVAIIYGDEFNGLPTANGEMFDPNAMTAAHPTLPLPSLIQVVNAETGQEVVLRVNDRGPFEDGASLQVSPRAASELGMGGAGKASLRVRYLGAAPAATTPATPSTPQQMMVQANYPKAEKTLQAGFAENKSLPATYEPAPAATGSATLPATYSYGATATTSQGREYYVQIGSFTDISNAQTMSNSVQASLPVTIVPARVNGADYFRVRVGPLSSRSEAERARSDLSYAGITQGRIVTDE